MAIPKKGSRKIVVGGVSYRWIIRRKPTYGEGLGDQGTRAVVELYQNPQSTLCISFPWLRNDSWMVVSAQPSITPQLIKQSIEKAIVEGWKPNNPGSAFQLEH